MLPITEVGYYYIVIILPYNFVLHHLENRMKPITFPYDDQRWWDSNLDALAWKLLSVPLVWQDNFFIKWHVLNVFIDIQTSKELIQMDTDKMMTYGTFTMDDIKWHK